MGSTVIAIPDGEGGKEFEINDQKEKKKSQNYMKFVLEFCFLREMKSSKQDMRRVIHSIKVGVALVLVSLLYLLDPLYQRVGDNAMWAIMTVIVIFEFFAGATLSKGLNRGMGTILGGGLGCLAAALAQEVGGIGNAIVVATSVFIFGAAATYTRLVPKIKKKYDYGAMIFILTFNLVVVSGLRAETVLQLARERLSTIVMGFVICICINLFVCPIWASNELHDSLPTKFEDLAYSLQGCLEEYFKVVNEKEKQPTFDFSRCKSLLNSKSKDDLLENFARWEPWHGKFGFSYPWKKYLQIGEVTRDMAAIILSFKGSLHSARQTSQALRASIKEPCEVVGASLAWTLRELGESIKKMRRCQTEATILAKLKSIRNDLSLLITPAATLGLPMENTTDGLEIASFVFSLMEMVNKIEELTKEVEQLGELAGFKAN